MTQMLCFCPEDVIFVLNKWDAIRGEEKRAQFFEKMKKKLQMIWKELNGDHIFQLSAEKVIYSIMFLLMISQLYFIYKMLVIIIKKKYR